jgi:prepilin-type N-terminal cleavage/methylation domain-containing protein
MKPGIGNSDSGYAGVRDLRKVLRGFSMLEVLMVLLISGILVGISIPVFKYALSDTNMTSTISGFSAAISQTRYASIMNSQIYTLALTVPADTYVVKNVSSGVSNPALPLVSQAVVINGGGAATYTFTLCPNGTVYGAGAVCGAPGNAAPPALTATSNGRQVNINVSTVGNVTTTIVH